jgi:hypothetical protein
VSTDEERAALLRAIAGGGYSPFEDQDGSTANTLYGWADELEQVARIKEALWANRDAHRKRRSLYSSLRRVYVRLRLRAKLRWLGLVPVLVLGTIVPTAGT